MLKWCLLLLHYFLDLICYKDFWAQNLCFNLYISLPLKMSWIFFTLLCVIGPSGTCKESVVEFISLNVVSNASQITSSGETNRNNNRFLNERRELETEKLLISYFHVKYLMLSVVEVAGSKRGDETIVH